VARKVERDPVGVGMPAIRVANCLPADEQALALFVLFVDAVTVAVAAADVWRTWRAATLEAIARAERNFIVCIFAYDNDRAG
jgi:hypothetical protein